MTDLCRLIFWTLVDLMRARATLEAEIWVLRQQINVLRRAAPRRQSFGIFDRLIFVGLYRLFPKACDALAIVKPDTIIRWHRAGFRAYWRWKSRRRGGRPTVPTDIRKLIHEMSIPAVAGAHWHPGLAGHCASALDLYRSHGTPPARPAAKTAAGWWNACARGDHDRLCRPQLFCAGLSDFFPDLHACRFAPCLGRSRTLLRHRPAHGCDLHGLADQPRITARRACAGRDYRLTDCGSHVRGRGAESALVMWAKGRHVQHSSLRSAPGHEWAPSTASFTSV